MRLGPEQELISEHEHPSLLARLLQRTGRFTFHRAAVVIAGTLAVGAVAAYGITRIQINDKVTGKSSTVHFGAAPGGHGGGDFGLMRAFAASLRGDAPMETSAEESLESHYLAFAAEEARTSGATVAMQAVRERAVAG